MKEIRALLLRDPFRFSDLEAFGRLATTLWSYQGPDINVLSLLHDEEPWLIARLSEERSKQTRPTAPKDVTRLISRLTRESANSVSPLLRLRRLTVSRFFGKKHSPVEVEVVVLAV